MDLDEKDFEYAGEISWEEIFGSWADDEAHQKRWQNLYKERGYDSWGEWRQDHVAPLELNKKAWRLYKIKNPRESVPKFYGGPFKTWREKYYGAEDTLTFTDIVKIPEIKRNERMQHDESKFPEETMLVGLVHRGRIIIIEGMHRCCAIAMADDGIDSEVMIALADFAGEKIPNLEKTTKSG